MSTFKFVTFLALGAVFFMGSPDTISISGAQAKTVKHKKNKRKKKINRKAASDKKKKAVAKKKEEDKLPIGGFVGIQQGIPAKDGKIKGTDLLAYAAYKVNDEHSFSLFQGGSIAYAPGGFSVWDSFLADNWSMGKLWGLKWGLRTSFTLPISEGSQKEELYSNLGMRLSVGYSKDILTLQYRPSAVYHWRRWSTKELTDEQKAEGRPYGDPTRMMTLNHQFIVSLALNDEWSANAEINSSYLVNNRNADQEKRGVPFGTTGSYSFDFGVGYAPVPEWAFTVGFTNGDSYLKEGAYSVYLYDVNSSNFYGNVLYNF